MVNLIVDEDDRFSKDLYYIKDFDPDFDLGERLQIIIDKYLNHKNKQTLTFIVKDKVKFSETSGDIRGAIIIDEDMEYLWYDHLGFTEHNLGDPDYYAWDPIFGPYGRPWSNKYE